MTQRESSTACREQLFTRSLALARLRRRCVWLLALALGATLAAPVSAQATQSASANDSSRNASARALFEDGVKLAEQADWVRAEDRFRRALSLRASPVIAYNLASALIERGKLVEARELLLQVEHDDKAEAGMRDSARKLQTDVSGRIGRVTVSVPGIQPGDSVMLDGNELLEAQLNVEIPADPGAHQLRLLRAGKALSARLVNVEPSGSQRVLLIAPAPLPTPREVAKVAVPVALAVEQRPYVTPPPTAASPRATTASQERPITRTWWFWTGIGVVTAAAVVAVAVVAAGSGGHTSEAAYRGDFAPASLAIQVNK
jgi:hypothetical protein